MVSAKNATSFKAADSSSLIKTTDDLSKEERIQTQRAGTSACTSDVPKVTSTSTIPLEYGPSEHKITARASPDNCVAGINHWPPTEVRCKVEHTEECNRQENDACGKDTTTSEATLQPSTASLAHSENDFVDTDGVYLLESILADRIAKDWNTSFYGKESAKKSTIVWKSGESLETASSSYDIHETDTADSGTLKDVLIEPLSPCEFQQVPTGDQSAFYHTDVSKLSSRQHVDYDGSFRSAHSAAAAPTCTNAVTDSLRNVPPQRTTANTTSLQGPQFVALRIVTSGDGCFSMGINIIPPHRKLHKIFLSTAHLLRSTTETHHHSLIIFTQMFPRHHLPCNFNCKMMERLRSNPVHQVRATWFRA
ncbi:hypothetical protein MRX96_031345 [Rhipicephalus microplus]